jgi:hypothetical protein
MQLASTRPNGAAGSGLSHIAQLSPSQLDAESDDSESGEVTTSG